MKTLGTILPDSKTRLADKKADEAKTVRSILARCIFKGMRESFEDGEQRFYESERIYNVLNKSGRKIRFEIRKDGTFSI